MANELREKTINGFFWQLGQKISCQLISFGISVVLARLLSPNDYGVVAICSMFLMLVGIIIDGGLGTALIQKKVLLSAKSQRLITPLSAMPTNRYCG